MKKLKLTQGFTIIELITVMIVILILAGLVVGAGARARVKAMQSKTEAMIAAIETAIAMYHVDTGLYPGRDNQNSTLVSDLTAGTGSGDSGWQGPYMEFKERDLSEAEVIDPWGEAYYYLTPGTHNTASFDLWSIGPDGEDETDDDIVNW